MTRRNSSGRKSLRFLQKTLAVLSVTIMGASAGSAAGEFTVGWSTYLGGGGWDDVASIVSDSSGNIFVAGYTDSGDFPTPGSGPTSRSSWDVFVSKLNTSGTLLQTFYLAGNAAERPLGLARENQGNLLLTGSTKSTDFPTSAAYDTHYHGGGASWGDVFVAKIRPDGHLIWSTYLGGSGQDYGKRIAADSAGNVYLCGQTYSSDFPTTGTFSKRCTGPSDAFVAKFSANGRLVWSTCFGGSQHDYGYGIALDGAANIYLGGGTNSTDFPTTGGFDRIYNGGAADGFVAKFTRDGSLLWSTYLGGNGTDDVEDVVWDGDGHIYIEGVTNSNDVLTSGAWDATYNGNGDGYLAKISVGGSLIQCTYFGGTAFDGTRPMVLDSKGNLFFIGFTSSADIPTTGGGDTRYHGGSLDAYLAEFTPQTQLLYGTLLGGNGRDEAIAIAADTTGSIFVVGHTDSTDFPTTRGWDRTYNGGIYDGFITKFIPTIPTPPLIATQPTSFSLSVAAGTQVATRTLEIWNNGGGTLTYGMDSTPSLFISVLPQWSQSSYEKIRHTVTFETAQLSTGAHTGQIIITGNATNSPVVIPVQINVVSPRLLVRFQNVTTTSGITATLPRSQAIGDYEGDGDLDLFFSEEGVAAHLFVNDGSGFFTDRAAAAGLALSSLGQVSKSIFWDFNNNGFLDLYIGQMSGNLHMVNQGDGTYVNDAALAGLLGTTQCNSAVALDYNQDGLLDLYLGQGGWNSSKVHLLLRNRGNGTFQDVTTTAGLGASFYGGGALVADYDLDGHPDIYVIHNGTNRFYRNNGNGTFTERTGIGTNDPGLGNGGAVGDYDNDGDFDIFIANDNGAVKLLRNNFMETGKLTFSDVTGLAGLGAITDNATDASFGDVDNDGDLDLYVSIHDDAGIWQDHFFLNNGNGTFTDYTTSAGLIDSAYRNGEGCGMADLNGDGKLEILVSCGSYALLKNVSTATGHWLSVDLRGTSSTREAVGARVTLELFTSGPIQVLERQCGKPRGTQDSPWLHFGLGTHSGPVEVTVNWPSGLEEGFWVDTVDRRVTLVEGSGSVPLPPVLAAEPPCTKGTTNSLSWTSVTSATAYYLEWSGNGRFAPVAGNSGWTTGTNHIATGLGDGRLYYYRVKCRNDSLDESDWSNIVSSRQDATTPTAPGKPGSPTPYTSLAFVIFNWTAAADPGTTPSGVASYDLQVGTGPGLSNILSGNVGNTLTRLVAGSNGQRLYARVRARDQAGNVGPWSPNSDGVLIDTVVPTTPGRPTDAGTYTSSTSVRFNWTAATDPGTTHSGVASYDLQVGTGPGLSDVFNSNVGNVLTRQITGSNGQRLYARVRARDQAGNMGPWSLNSDGILVDTAPPAAPPKPTGAGTYTSSTTVRFNWSAATDPGASPSGVISYDLQVGTGPGMSNAFNGNVGNVLTRQITGSNGQRLYARVRARDRAGNIGSWSPNSDGVLIDTVVPTTPGRPTDAGTYTSSTSVRFNWTAATDPGTTPSGVASYDVQVGTGPGLSNVFNGNVGNVLTRQVTGSNGQRLYARVRARDRAGNIGSWSPNSDGILIDTVAPTAPGTPTSPGLYTSSTLVRFNWTGAKDPGTNPSGVASYDLQVGTGPGLSNVFNGNVGNVLTRQVSGSNGQQLYARVRARDRAGNIGAWSGYSAGVTVDTIRPRLKSITALSYGILQITFDEPVVNADRALNYTCSRGLVIEWATQVSGTQYLLYTRFQAPGTIYTLTVGSGVKDRAGNPMDSAHNSLSFTGGVVVRARSWSLYR